MNEVNVEVVREAIIDGLRDMEDLHARIKDVYQDDWDDLARRIITPVNELESSWPWQAS